MEGEIGEELCEILRGPVWWNENLVGVWWMEVGLGSKWLLGLSAENDERRDPITGVEELLSNMIHPFDLD
jgi:hypothetical protein